MEKKNRIKDLPEQARPYEKCFSYGPNALSDAELLAVIIRTGANGIRSDELAGMVLEKTGDKGITGICSLSIEELTDIKGIGKVKAIQLQCIAELSRRIAKSVRKVTAKLVTPQAVADYYMEEMRHKDKEELKVIMLDAKSALLGETTVSIGTVNFTVASPREIFLEALKYKAVNVIVMHNHPSGDPTPSQNDISCTRRIREAGELIGISLIDHIIIGDNSYYSFNEKRIL
jgi:DNA repair protein RadC